MSRKVNTSALAGSIRLDESIPRLAGRLEPGEIAIIEFPDLDRSSALALLSRRPVAVLNAASFTTGRRPSLGAQLLVDGGITLVDDLGSDLMTLTEGDQVRIQGGDVYRGDELIASGQRRDSAELHQAQASGRERLGPAVESFARTAGLTWESESEQYLHGEGVPPVPALSGRTVVVVTPGLTSIRQLRRLKAFCNDFSAYFIAVGEGANSLKSVGRKPDLILGDISNLPEPMLTRGTPLVLLERPDGQVTGGDRANVLTLKFMRMVTSAAPADAAVLLADANGADQIVLVGDDEGIEGFLEKTGSEVTAGFFIQLRSEAKLVSAPAVQRLYRPGVRTWQLVLMLIAALLVMVAAVLFTPWGQSLGWGLYDWVQGWWPWAGDPNVTAAYFGS